MVKANGAAFYNANATGKLAYLSNTVSVYTDEVDKHGNGGSGVGMEQVTNNVWKKVSSISPSDSASS